MGSVGYFWVGLIVFLTAFWVGVGLAAYHAMIIFGWIS